MPLALPIALVFLSALAISLLAFSYLQNKRYAIAAAIFMFGVVANVAVGKIVNGFLDHNSVEDISRTYTLSASVLLTLLFIVAGYVRAGKANK